MEVICHNSDNKVTVSGPEEKVKHMVSELKAKGITVTDVKYDDIGLHSPAVENMVPMFQAKMKQVNFYSVFLATGDIFKLNKQFKCIVC